MKIQKQQAMRNVLAALAPLCLAALYFYGWRFLAILAVTLLAAVASEYLMAKRYGMKMTESVFVSSVLFALSLPPHLPLWMAGVGIAFGIVFGKMVFGGFGKNIFNPAITARAFVYISFGVPMTSDFVQSATRLSVFPAGLGTWISKADSVSAATPLINGSETYLNLFLGNVSGSFGEASALLILLGGAYILYKKAANWNLVVSSLLSFTVLQAIIWLVNPAGHANPLYSLLSGGFLFASFFMITDPVSASQSTDIGKWLYGALFGCMTVVIRNYSNWPEGVTFAILLANMFGPLMDHLLKQAKAKRKKVAQGGGAS